MGAIEYLQNRFGNCVTSKRRKKASNHKHEFKEVELHVLLDCEGCELRVKKCLESMKGVDSVDVDRGLQKVTVVGYVDAEKVIERVKAKGKVAAEPWPYVPHKLVTSPFAADVYDKKNPPNHVIRTDAHYNNFLNSANSGLRSDERFNLFHEDNTSSCTVM